MTKQELNQKVQARIDDWYGDLHRFSKEVLISMIKDDIANRILNKQNPAAGRSPHADKKGKHMLNFIKEELLKEAKKEWDNFLNRLDRPSRIVPTFIEIDKELYNINSITQIDPKPRFKPETGEKYWYVKINDVYKTLDVKTYTQLINLLRLG